MNRLLFGIFASIAAAMIAPAIWRKDYRLQFPCLAGLTVIYQIALPLASLNSQPDEVSAASTARFSFMAILCLLAAWAGYEWWQGPTHSSLIRFDPKRLITSAIVLAVLGGFFTLKFKTITPEYDPEAGGMTGIGTIYLTLSSIARYGFMLAAILFARTKNWKLLLLILPQLWSYFEMFMVGRRSQTGEIMVVICLLLFFYGKWALPLWLMLLGMFGMAVFCFNIDTIRSTIDEPLSERVEAVQEADLLHSLSKEGMAEQRNFVEVFNAANFMEAKVVGGHYTYGLHFWNKFVFGFVPAQFVGKRIKDSLMIPLEDDTKVTGFEKGTGTCETGIGEAFMAFGYFGCGLFFPLGAFMRWLWEGAIRNSILHQFLLMLFVIPAVMSFSAQLWTILNAAITIAIFAGPLLWWSKVKDLGMQRRIRSRKPVLQT